jgi:hypothetical protein
MENKNYNEYWSAIKKSAAEKASIKLGIFSRFLGLAISIVASLIFALVFGANIITSISISIFTAIILVFLWYGVYFWYQDHEHVVVHNEQQKKVHELLQEMDNSSPYIISNDNLSLGGPGLSIDSISLINIGEGMAILTNITSDMDGNIRIIDKHYMEKKFIEQGTTPHNIMVNEAKIIEGLGADIVRPSSMANDWVDPFFIYVWYESLHGQKKFCTKIGFQSGERFIRRLDWERFEVK